MNQCLVCFTDEWGRGAGKAGMVRNHPLMVVRLYKLLGTGSGWMPFYSLKQVQVLAVYSKLDWGIALGYSKASHEIR